MTKATTYTINPDLLTDLANTTKQAKIKDIPSREILKGSIDWV